MTVCQRTGIQKTQGFFMQGDAVRCMGAGRLDWYVSGKDGIDRIDGKDEMDGMIDRRQSKVCYDIQIKIHENAGIRQ